MYIINRPSFPFAQEIAKFEGGGKKLANEENLIPLNKRAQRERKERIGT